MKLAIPLSQGLLSQHFGHSEQFLLVEADQEQRSILAREVLTAPEHVPGFLPQWLQEHGVNVVIAAGMGVGAQDLLTANSISVISGAAETDPEMLVTQFLDGTIKGGTNGCDHSGHTCQH